MENEEVTPLEGVTPPDFTELENQISDLVEVIQAEQELKAEEQAKAEEVNAQAEIDNQDFQAIYSTNSESQTLALEGLQAEMSAMNSNLQIIISNQELMHSDNLAQYEKSNILTGESSLTITIAIIVVAAVKILTDQISKW